MTMRLIRRVIARLLVQKRGCDPQSLPAFGPRCMFGRVIKIVDGDTCWLAVWEGGRHCRLSVRLNGIDTPELRAKNPEEQQLAQDAKAYLYSLVHDKVVRVEWHGTEKYGRHLVKLFRGSTDINEQMLAQGHAREYHGGRRKPFLATKDG